MRKFLTIVCAIFAIQILTGVLLWAACPTNCTCSKPVNGKCALEHPPGTSGGCSWLVGTPRPGINCADRFVVINHEGPFLSGPSTEETNVGINAAVASVPCFTMVSCHLNDENVCVQKTPFVNPTKPLRPVPCS